jgi:hypothetical protein
MSSNDTPKERLVQQFIDSQVNGEASDEDIEDVRSELTLMELEGLDLKEFTVRDILKRFGIL